MPIHMRMRKLRGPHMKKSMPFEQFRTHTQPVNLRDLEARFDDGAEVTPDALAASGLATRKGIPVKILGERRASKKLTVHAHGFSKSAREKIEAAGGSAATPRGASAVLRDAPQLLPDPRRSEEARLHGGDAGAVPHRRLHPRAGHQHRRASRRSRENFAGSNVLGFLNLFSGGSLQRFAIFALGIMPYITASIILQLMQVVVPSLEKLRKEGEVGQQKITQYTRYLTVALAFAPVDRLRLPLPDLRHRRRSVGGRGLHLRARLRDRGHAHRRLRAAHVVRRADHPARHRQRHLADDLRDHRVRPAERASSSGGPTRTRSSR